VRASFFLNSVIHRRMAFSWDGHSCQEQFLLAGWVLLQELIKHLIFPILHHDRFTNHDHCRQFKKKKKTIGIQLFVGLALVDQPKVANSFLLFMWIWPLNLHRIQHLLVANWRSTGVLLRMAKTAKTYLKKKHNLPIINQLLICHWYRMLAKSVFQKLSKDKKRNYEKIFCNKE
jgi:hypothetical protein